MIITPPPTQSPAPSTTTLLAEALQYCEVVKRRSVRQIKLGIIKPARRA